MTPFNLSPACSSAAHSALTRRSFLLAASASAAFAHSTYGPVRPPQAVPDASVLCHDGQRRKLSEILAGRATAVQWIFTSCTSMCPMQGAIFDRVQKRLPNYAARGIQLLTLSVDPEHDSPEALATWLKRFHAATPGWLAAAPKLEDVNRLRGFFTDTKTFADSHTTEVFLVNRDGALIWRTAELPEPATVAQMLDTLAKP